MTSTIKIKNSSTAGAVPGSGDLVQGELAVNVTDKKIYTKNASGTIVNLGTTPSITDNGNAEAIVIDSSENIGIGVTPSAWTTFTALQVKNTALMGYNTETHLAANTWYSTGTAYKYISNGYAARYSMNDVAGGAHAWFTAASGTAGNAITFTQAMTLDANGRLGIGPTSPSTVLHTSSSTAGIFAQGTSTKTNNLLFTCSNSYNYGVVGVVSGDNTSGGDIYALGYVASAGGSFNPVASWTSSGNLLVGSTSNTSSAAKLRVYQSDTANPSFTSEKTTTAVSNHVLWYNPNGVVGAIGTNGSTTYYNTSSDYRLKHDIQPMTSALDKVAALKPVTYKWNADNSDGEGFIAHELAEICPQAVVGAKDAVDEDGNPVYQGIDTSFLVATLTAAIQELKAEFDAYKATHP